MRSKYGVEKLIPEGSKQKRKKIEGEILKKKKRQKAELILSETNILRNLGTKLMKPNSKDNVLKCVENGKIKITLCNEKQHRRNDLVSKKNTFKPDHSKTHRSRRYTKYTFNRSKVHP